MNRKSLVIILATALVIVLLGTSFYFKSSQSFVRADAPEVVTQGFFKKWLGRAFLLLGAPLYAYDAFHSAIALLDGDLDPARFGHLLLILAKDECQNNPNLIRVRGTPLYNLI